MANVNENAENLEEKRLNFYKNAQEYWSKVDASLNGVLGGYGYISCVDIRASHNFLTTIFKDKRQPGKSRALDCGAGIGRITKDLLIRHFETVDLLDFNDAFLSEAKRLLEREQNIGHFINSSLQDFKPFERYDVIWCQWVLGHLTDDDLVGFLKRCADSLRPSGLIIIKENISSHEAVEDPVDSSVTRNTEDYLHIFKRASLRVIRQASQTNLPSFLFSVKIFALSKISEYKIL